MTDWQRLASKTEYDCGWFTAGYDRVVEPSGREADYYWVDKPKDGLGIVAVTDDDRVAMVEQYRPKLEASFVECPGGYVEPGESYVDAAERELKEETRAVGRHHRVAVDVLSECDDAFSARIGRCDRTDGWQG